MAQNNVNDSSTGEVRGLIQRADPTGRYRRAVQETAWARNPVVRSLVAMSWPSGAAVLHEIAALSRDLQHLVTAYERWAPLTRLGWAITDLAGPAAYDEAVHLLSDRRPEQAEQVLEEWWNLPEKLELAVSRIGRTAAFSEARIRAGRERQRLFEEAVVAHRSGLYTSALSITVLQMEGMVRELDLPSPYQQPSKLVDDQTPGGHPTVLQVIYELARKSVKKTTLDDHPFPLRHGIAHGRHLAPGTRRNSTKAFVAAAELATFCRTRIEAVYDEGNLHDLDRKVFGWVAEDEA